MFRRQKSGKTLRNSPKTDVLAAECRDLPSLGPVTPFIFNETLITIRMLEDQNGLETNCLDGRGNRTFIERL